MEKGRHALYLFYLIEKLLRLAYNNHCSFLIPKFGEAIAMLFKRLKLLLIILLSLK